MFINVMSLCLNLDCVRYQNYFHHSMTPNQNQQHDSSSFVAPQVSPEMAQQEEVDKFDFTLSILF